jgi:ubiquinone/menaquinone biosynthesis C-methylase UbiE
MSVSSAYTKWSATYDEMENPTRDLDRIVTRENLSGLQCHAILELGCGTGKNTSLLSELGDAVLAVDFSEGMLARAQQKVQAPNVTFKIADITKPWIFVRDPVDLIVINLVLEHIADLSHVFAEAARCLQPGGRLFICELHPFRQYLGLKANFEYESDKIEVTAFVHHISEFIDAATNRKLTLVRFEEWWHQPDHNKPPLLASFLFQKAA